MIPVPKNRLQEQFEFERQCSQEMGTVSSLTFEEWLKAKEKMNASMTIQNNNK